MASSATDLTSDQTTRRAIEILEKLVGFNTVSSESNVPLIEWAANYLDGFGFKSRIQKTADGRHANLFSSIGPADGEGVSGGVVLAGHSDVVPVEGQPWTTDPFKLIPQQDRLLARGSADMKGFIACCMARAEQFSQPGLKQAVHIALSYNEETNMQGMQDLTDLLAKEGLSPSACVIGEPTMMQVVVANKGAAIFKVSVRGFPAHSSLRDTGVSAVEYSAEIISYLNAIQKRLRDAERHDGFDFPFTSLHAGRIHGGTAHNITAQDCEFVFEIRALPGVDANEILGDIQQYCDTQLLPAMKAISDECAITIEPVVNSPGLDETTNRNLAHAIMPLCNCLTPGRVSFGTEAGFMTQAGVPTVVCGPGSIHVAHQPDEFVEVSQLGKCVEFLDTLDVRLRQSALLQG